MNHDDIRKLFVGALYGELTADEKKDFDNHLTACSACAVEFNQLRETLTIMDRRKRDEPDEAYWSNYWQRLSAKLDEQPESRAKVFKLFPESVRVPAWAYGIAAVFLIFFGVYLGRNYFASHDTVSEGSTPATGTQPRTASASDTLDDRALAYLERSRNLLIGLVNLDSSGRSSPNLARQQQASRQLIDQAAYLKVALNKPNRQLMRQLILDLEVILLQLANVEVKPGVPAVELVKRGVDQKSILLKINLEEMRASSRRSATSNEKFSKQSM